MHIHFIEQIRGLKHRVQRERHTLKEEKQLIKLMKELKEEKDEVVALLSFKNKQRQDVVVKNCVDLLYNYKKIPMENWPQVRFGSGILYIYNVCAQ